MSISNVSRALALIASGVMLSLSAQALPTDRNQPIHISADQARIDEAKGTTVYTGNVQMTQGSMVISAARVDLYRERNEVSRVVATGSLAKFSQQPSADQPVTDAYGETMEYKIAEQTVTITGKARVEQNQDTFSGERIVYQMDKAVVNAYSGKGNSGQRVQMVIQPKASQ